MAEYANTPGIAGQPGQGRQAVGNGTLIGKVMKGPTFPVSGPGTPYSTKSAPGIGVRLLILNPAGQEIESVVTDDHGEYRRSLPSGTYRIEMAPLAGIEFTKDLPATITITERQETRLDIRIDTGIR
jgi:hypothetical protein